MGFIEGVEERALPIRQAILEHPFVRGIGAGDLDVERFKYYIAQDYVYLIDYARVLALGAARAPELEVMSWFAGLLDETLNTEMELHRGYCARFGITREELEATRPAPTTVAYTSYLLRVASQGSFGELAASLLPCQWGYWEIGEHLDRQGPPTHAPLYAEWVGYVLVRRVPRPRPAPQVAHRRHRQRRLTRRAGGNGDRLCHQPTPGAPVLGHGLEDWRSGRFSSLRFSLPNRMLRATTPKN